MEPTRNERLERRIAGWSSWPARMTSGALLFLTLSGLLLWFAPFSVFNQHGLLLHTVVGLALTPIFGAYLLAHARRYWSIPLSQVKFSGWAAACLTVACFVSGLVLTWEALLGTRITYGWRVTHELTTLGSILFVAPHYVVIALRERSKRRDPSAVRVWNAVVTHARTALGGCLALTAAVALMCFAVQPQELVNEFPADYEHEPYEGAGPFAPSLARTNTGGAFDARVLAGSDGCGVSGCHQEIYDEWRTSAHGYAAKDAVFQGIQALMAQQNGPVSTRYCAGCHDPISLFSGEKSFAAEALTGKAGLEEGVSCLVCHAIEQTDIKGNASYVVHSPTRYVWEGRDGAVAQLAGKFVMRAYPDQHVKTLSKRMFKTPEFCAACHKQFIDQDVNDVGWVQLQNQYDNWKASRWNHPGDASQTLECRECHMPLQVSTDPAAGDSADFNRTDDDGRHRSHRFLGANQFIPTFQSLPGGEEHCALTELWLKGEYDVPEIADRWRAGPAVPIELETPDSARAGENISIKVHLLNNKVGHDFPTGPLDIIQSWVEVVVRDASGRELFHSGAVNDKRFIETGAYMFKAEPVDRYGNLIDRHNLWEMVGVRFKRSLFPGQAEVARFDFPCPGGDDRKVQDLPQERALAVQLPADVHGELSVEARLRYRKVDQYLIHFAFGPDSSVTSPVTDVSVARATIRIAPSNAESDR